MEQPNWQQVIDHFEKQAKEYNKYRGGELSYNNMAVADICRYIMNNSRLSQTLEIRNITNHALYIGPVHSFPNKQFKAEAIEGNRVEFCLMDSTTRVERYFFPHAPYGEALDRFKAIISNISWDDPVKKNSKNGMSFRPNIFYLLVLIIILYSIWIER